MSLPRGRVTYCIASFRNCLHFRTAVQPRLNQHASAQSLKCQKKQKFSSQAIIWEHIKDFVSHAKNLYNSWLVKQRKCSQKGFGFLCQAYSVAENLLFLASTEIEEQGQSSALLDTVVRRGGSSSNTGKFSECSSTLQHRGSNQPHPTSHPRTEWHWPPSIHQLSQISILLTGGHLSAPGCISPHSSWLHCAQPQWHGQWTGEPHPAPAPEKQYPSCYCALQRRFFSTRSYGRRDHSTVNSQSLCLGKKVTVTSTKVQWSMRGDQRQSFTIMQ